MYKNIKTSKALNYIKLHRQKDEEFRGYCS